MPDCAPDPDSGFANVNMDAIADQAVSVHFTTKEAHTDSDREDHPATDGTFEYEVSYRHSFDSKNLKCVGVSYGR